MNTTKCEHCAKELQPLNPPIEDYTDHKFCINIFGWKFMLLKDQIELGCLPCWFDKQRSKRSDEIQEAINDAISKRERMSNI